MKRVCLTLALFVSASNLSAATPTDIYPLGTEVKQRYQGCYESGPLLSVIFLERNGYPMAAKALFEHYRVVGVCGAFEVPDGFAMNIASQAAILPDEVTRASFRDPPRFVFWPLRPAKD